MICESRVLLAFVLFLSALGGRADELASRFADPPSDARPWVYWMWMGSNISTNGIAGDLRALKDEGFGGTVMVSLADICTPWPAPIANSPTPDIVTFNNKWWQMVRFAAQESHRLGLQFGFHNCAGYETSGGPWITPDLSMQEAVWSETKFTGPGKFTSTLPRPTVDIHADQPFPVYIDDTGRLEKPEVPARQTYFRDIAVLAVPASGVIATNQIFDLSDKLSSEGKLEWDAPPGDWVIYRFGHTTTGAMIQPCQWAAIGLECDKMSRKAVEFHLDHIIAETKKDCGDLVGHGLDFIWFDSYEAGTPTWTPKMREDFQARRGYDLTDFLPTLAKRTVGSAAETRKFNADFTRTIHDLYRDNYFAVIREKLHAAGLQFRCEPYTGPWNISEVVTDLDGVTAEFWVRNGQYDPSAVPKVVAAARQHGINDIDAEAFTAWPKDSQWSETPAKLKPIGDAAFCDGVNRFILHRFVEQPWDDRYEPGLAMGQWGTHFDRTQTWWDPFKATVKYWQRCDALLRWGRIATYDFRVEKADGGLSLKSIHRRSGSNDAYFVANLAWTNGAAECVFGVSGRQPELWNPVTGEMRDLPEFESAGGKTIVPLEFAPAQSWFVVFRKPVSHGKTIVGAKNFPELKVAGEITGPWSVTFDPKWGGPAEPVEFATLEDWTHRAEPGIRYYSGTAVYERKFDLPNSSAENRTSRMFLDLGTVHDIAQVNLNGRDLGVVWTAPWRVDITRTVKTSGNRLVIKITNCWANRQIGDEQQPPDCEFGRGDEGYGGPLKAFPEWLVENQPRPSAGRYTFTTWNYFNKNSPLEGSGLLGPVQILEQQSDQPNR
jgi:(4-O-methyl)-D-glucuronate---lignin esterase